MKKHFLHKDTMHSLVREFGIQRATEMLIVFFRMKELYVSGNIVNKSPSDIARATGINVKRLYVILPILEQHGLIVREYGDKKITKLRSERMLAKKGHELIYFEINKEHEIEQQKLYIIAKYTEYMTRTQSYAVERGKSQRSQREKKGNARPNKISGQKKYVTANDYVTVTDAWLQKTWNMSNSHTNKIKRILYGLGYFKLNQVLLFICNADRKRIAELRDAVDGHCFVKENKAYKHLGTAIEFGKYNGKQLRYVPITNSKIINK